MFENLLHQEGAAGRLRHDVAEGMLPPAVLMSGPALSGKLTAALELARSLSCSKSGAWNCPCAHCRSHRALSHPRTLLTGSRNLMPEIAASAEVLRRDTSDGSRFLAVRSARKLLRRFDSVLWEGEEKKLQKARGVMERLSETVQRLLPGVTLPDEGALDKLLDALVDDCGVLQGCMPAVLPVSQVRRITAWAVHSAPGDHKTVILDGAERMPDASKNALLKFLEEPPPDTTVVMVTERKSLLLPTLVSRLRDYPFRARSRTEEEEVLRRVFREDEKRWSGLAEYFRSWRSGPSEEIQKRAVEFVDSAREGRPNFPENMELITDSLDLHAFLEAVSMELQKRWRMDEQTPHKRSAAEAAALREARVRSESLNIPVQLVLRRLYAVLGAGVWVEI